jgi:tetratricopeptide (TPR) repeat protein
VPRGTRREAQGADEETLVIATRSTGAESWLRAVAHASAESPASPPLAPGTRLCRGRFVIGPMLGRGGMGAVYEVRDGVRGADLALKTLLHAAPERLLAFKQEFRALQDLVHPNLVRLDELFEDGGRWFFTMERIRGVRFTEYVHANGLDELRLRRGLEQLARGLLALHGANKVHRDIKPSNTLVEPTGRVVLLDFGLIGDARRLDSALMPGAGTAAYMAPEQFLGSGGREADWYSVGVMLYQALTGTLPFPSDATEMVNYKLGAAPRPPSELQPGVPADLERLCLDLLQRAPEARPDGEAILQRLLGRAPFRPGEISDGGAKHFVGRAHELGRLREALSRGTRSGSTTVMIRGESGVGKTALLDAFLGELAGRRPPVTVLAGRCYEREFVPFKALDGVIDALARHLDQIEQEALGRILPPSSVHLARLFPVLGRAYRRRGLETAATDSVSPTAARASAIRSLQRLLGALAQRGPVVLAIDDLHWADVDSLRAIEDLLHGPAAPRVLLIVLARTGTRPPRASGASETIALGPLLAEDATELARRLLAERPRPDDGGPIPTPTWLAEEAGRHPLFMEAMLRHGLSSREVDVRLEEALAARVAGLSAEARGVVEVVSTATHPLSAPAVALATGLAADRLFRVVRDLQIDRLVMSRRDGDALSIEPYHDQIRRAVVGGMEPERERACHGSIAETLERLAPDVSAPLVVHWRAAGQSRRARAHAIRAGHHARRVLAFDRAATYYQTALDLSQDAAGESDLHRWHAEALAYAGRPTESANAYQAAAAAAAGDDRTELERCAAEQLLRGGEIVRGLSVVDGILSELGMARPRTLTSAVRSLILQRLLAPVDWLIRRLVPLGARRARKLARQADACWTTALGLAGLDPIASAVFQVRHLRISRRLGDATRVALGLCMRAPQAAFSGGPATRAHRILARVRAMMHDRHDPLVEGYTSLASGAAAFLQGRFEAALDSAERAITSFRRLPGPVTWELANAQRFALDCLWHTGRIRKLRTRAWNAWREAGRRGDRYLTMQIESIVLPIVHLAHDDVPAARAVIDQSLAHWPRLRLSMPHWAQAQTRTLIELYAGRPVEALAVMEAQMRSPEQVLFSRIQAIRVFSLFLHATALVAVAARRPPDAASLLRRAERDVRRIEATRAAGDTVALLRGQLAFLGGDRQAAAAAFASAEGLFAQRGMRLASLVARHGHGLSVGGEAGRRLMDETRRLILAQEILVPEGFIRLYAPGLAPETLGLLDAI